MHFKDWMEKTDTPFSTAARMLGLSRPMIYNYAKSTHVPSIKIALRIEKFTDGQVTLYDWIREESPLDSLL